MTIKFDGGLTLSISVSNLDRSIDWYRDLFQGELLYRLDDIAWCEISSPTQRVNLGLSQVEEVKVGGPTPTFGVTDIEASKTSLPARSIAVACLKDRLMFALSALINALITRGTFPPAR